jgi:hypothetical protein
MKMSFSRFFITGAELTTFLSVDLPQSRLPLIPCYQRRLGQWKVVAPSQGLPRDKDTGGLRVPLSYVLLQLNRAALIERFPVAFPTLEKVDNIRSQLITQGVNCTMPVVQATHYGVSVASIPMWVCWLDRKQLDCTRWTMRASPTIIHCNNARGQIGAGKDHECIILPSGERMGGFYLFQQTASAETSFPQPAPGCRPHLKIRRPCAQTAPTQAAAQDYKSPDYQPYKRLFPVWVETPDNTAVEGWRAQRREGIQWQIAATTDDFSRTGHAIVRITQAEATKTGLKDDQ